jgi:hypothetical protein
VQPGPSSNDRFKPVELSEMKGDESSNMPKISALINLEYVEVCRNEKVMSNSMIDKDQYKFDKIMILPVKP